MDDFINTYGMSRSRERGPLDWHTFTASIIPKHHLARICTSNIQIGVESGKTARRHSTLQKH